MFEINIAKLRKYNEGELVAEWISLPATEEELNKVFEKIGVSPDTDEFFIADYDNDCEIVVDEYEDLEKLNDLADYLERFDDDERKVFSCCINEMRVDFDEALEIVRNGNYCIYYDCHDMEDVAMQYIEDCGYLEDAPSHLADYFDYERFGRDLEIEGNFFECDDLYIQIIR